MKYFILIIMLSFCFCTKEDSNKTSDAKNGTATFYTLDTYNWSLLINGVDHGTIVNTTQTPVCGDTDHHTLSLKPGTYTVDAKSLSGIAWGNPRDIVIEPGKCKLIKLP